VEVQLSTMKEAPCKKLRLSRIAGNQSHILNLNPEIRMKNLIVLIKEIGKFKQKKTRNKFFKFLILKHNK
jgi:hypothetical protein